MELYGINFCECGCCEEITRKGDKKYKYRHNKKYLENIPDQFCKCGCGEIVNKGKVYINHHFVHNEITRQQISLVLMGHSVSKETRKKQSDALKGHVAWNKGLIGVQEAWNKGLKGCYSEETKQQMSISARKVWEDFKYQINLGFPPDRNLGNYGKHPTEETKRLISDGNLGKIRTEKSRLKQSKTNKGVFSGENHPNWKGGITKDYIKQRNSDEYKQWRKFVYKRDDYKCHRCNNGGGTLIAHHIINFAKLAKEKQYLWDINNGITFCKDCHDQFHKKFGYKNNNQQQIFEFVYENH